MRLKKSYPIIVFLAAMLTVSAEMLILTNIYVNSRKSIFGALVIMIVFFYGNAWQRRRTIRIENGECSMAATDILFIVITLAAIIGLFLICRFA